MKAKLLIIFFMFISSNLFGQSKEELIILNVYKENFKEVEKIISEEFSQDSESARKYKMLLFMAEFYKITLKEMKEGRSKKEFIESFDLSGFVQKSKYIPSEAKDYMLKNMPSNEEFFQRIIVKAYHPVMISISNLAKDIYERDGLDKSLKYLENNKLGISKMTGEDFDKKSWINLWNYTHSIESSVALLKNNPERHYKILLDQLEILTHPQFPKDILNNWSGQLNYKKIQIIDVKGKLNMNKFKDSFKNFNKIMEQVNKNL